MKRRCFLDLSTAAALAVVTAFWGARPAEAHCDTLDGPVVAAGRVALERGDITPALKWVAPEHEAEIKAVFARVLPVRELGPRAREVADTYFFETLVRVHREGEGAPYTGLKPSGAVDPAVEMADQALENGSVDRLVAAVTTHLEAGIRERFVRAFQARQHADESVDAGREFVAAYVDLTHFVEGLHRMAADDGGLHGNGGAATAPMHEH